MKSPFEDLTPFQRNKLFNLLGVHIFKFAKSEEILPTIKNENIIGIILEGSAQINNIEYNGDEIVSEQLVKDSIFGSNISGTNREDCQIIAKENTQVVVIDYDKLINPINIKYSYFNVFFRNLFDIINSKFKESNERIEILEKKQIREKLLKFFEIEYNKTFLRNINLDFSLRELADYLAVNRSAMFRELKRLKEDKFIKINGRRITLLYK